MNTIQDEWVALDTNQFIFALGQQASTNACKTLLFEHLPQLQIYVPLQIMLELHRNLAARDMRRVFLALNQAKNIWWDYTPATSDLVRLWEQRGAKKGDAVIAAHLEAANIPYLISENRHFLLEIPNLPFTVLTSQGLVSGLEIG